MYHSITFGDKNTWDDWKLVPASRPVFNPPSLKKRTVDIPGADGFLDLSEALTGYPVYENREGSFDFYVMNGFKEWYQAFSDISDYLHGQSMHAILEDDREFYYDGRFTVNEWRSEKDYSRIVIDYSVNPYKWSIHHSLEGWEWDPFNFRTGVITLGFFRNIDVPAQGKHVTFDKTLLGRAPVCPKFIINGAANQGMRIHYTNSTLNVSVDVEANRNGTFQFPEIVFYGDSVSLDFQCNSGTGKVSIDFRQGRL